MANLTTLANTADTKYAEVVNDSDAAATGVNPTHLKTLLHNIFIKVDEAIGRSNTHNGIIQTPEMIQDLVGAMFSGNTETGISATYADNGENAGKIDLAVTSILVDEDDMSSDSTTLAPTQQSVKAYVDASISGLVDSSPDALNTLNELATALNDDASFSTTVTNSLATKAPKANPTFTGTIAIPNISNLESAVSNNTSKVSNVSTSLSVGTNNTTQLSITSDGGADDVTLPVATSSLTGVMNSAMFDKLDGIASNANNYSHPTGNGNNHIPSNGSAGQFLKYSSAGTAVWAADNNTTYSVGDGGLTQNNFTNTLKSKLDGIEASATADQTQSDINGLAITEVGTISSGVWNGTAIADSYISSASTWDAKLGSSGNNTYTGTLTIDRNKTPSGLTSNIDGILIDYDRTNTPSSGIDLNTGINIDMDLAGATSAGIQMATGVQSIITFSAHGGAAVTGSAGYFQCIGGDAGKNIGIGIKTEGVGPDIKIYSNDNTLDYCAIYTETNGATTIKTVDADAELAHLTINPKGNLILAPELGYIKIADGGHTAFELKNINDAISKLTLNAAGWIALDDTDTCGISKHPTTDRIAINVGGHMLLDLVESASTSTGQSSYAAVSGVVRLGPTGGVADTPPTNYGALYNNGGVLYYKNDAGTVTNLLAGGGGGGTSYWNWQQSMRWYTRYNNWYAPNATYGPAYYNWTQQWSTTPPTSWADSSNTMIVVPKNMTITSYHIHGNFTGASTYELHIKKGTPSYGTNGNTSLSQLGSTQSLVVGTSNMNVKIEETGLSVSLSAGDIIIPFLRRSANNTSSYYFFEGVLNIMGEYA